MYFAHDKVFQPNLFSKHDQNWLFLNKGMQAEWLVVSISHYKIVLLEVSKSSSLGKNGSSTNKVVLSYSQNAKAKHKAQA